MKVGDLIRYSIGNRGVEPPIGVIIKTPGQTNNGDYEVYFIDGWTGWCREIFMKVINESW